MHYSKQKKMKKKNNTFFPHFHTQRRGGTGGTEGEKMRKEKGDTKRDLLIFLIPHSSFVLPLRLRELCVRKNQVLS
jgi:hypothetical protein